MLKLLLLALSLCADCFAVSLCSSVTLKNTRIKAIITIALCFAVIQAGLLLLGWAFGYAFVGLIETIAHWIGFLLLLYVGGSMIIEALRCKGECRNLNGLKNIILGGIATSIDASAVGVSQSMSGVALAEALELFAYVFIITFASVVLAICLGKALGSSKTLGRWVEIVGGVVLISIGIGILL